jgi:predicted MFS family arabinose efflux permease
MYIALRLMATPCWCLLSMLAFILYKNMHLTPVQITIIVALKPMSSLLSPYWSLAIYQRPDRLIANLTSANLIRHLPFLFLPWIDSSWFIIFSFGLYMMLTSAKMPAWMELFKYNLPKMKREQLVSYGTIVDFLGTALLAVGMSILLDRWPEMWKALFSFTAVLGLLSTLFLIAIPAPKPCAPLSSMLSQPNKILQPWKQVWELVCQRKDFTCFQIGFMLCGAGLIIMKPALPQFFIDVLHLSFVEMGLAIALCKGIGVALTSPFWTRLFRKTNIFQLSAVVAFFAMLFPFFLMTSSWHLVFFYFGYAIYGIMEAGSELTWHMSGLVFAQEKDSSTYSTTNLIAVGIRGCLIPALGAMLLLHIDSLGVILIGALLCLLALGFFLLSSRALKQRLVKKESV